MKGVGKIVRSGNQASNALGGSDLRCSQHSAWRLDHRQQWFADGLCNIRSDTGFLHLGQDEQVAGRGGYSLKIVPVPPRFRAIYADRCSLPGESVINCFKGRFAGCLLVSRLHGILQIEDDHVAGQFPSLFDRARV